MGPKKQAEKDSSAVSINSDNNEDQGLIDELEQLKLKPQISEKQNSVLADRLRANESESVRQRDELVRNYQEKISEINTENERQIQELSSSRNGVQSEHRTYNRQRQFDVPLPRQLLFDGKNSWESFIHPFEAMVNTCCWDENEQLFRLKNSLRGEAAEYAFRQISDDTLLNYQKLKSAMETRFMEKRSTSSYLAELENKRFVKDKESLAEYVADIKRLVLKGYPTADSKARETINLRHFLKGLSDSQAALFIGMKGPKSIEEARELLETYSSLREDVKSVRVRNVDSKSKQEYVTEARLQEFGRDLKSNVGKKIDNLANLIKQQEKSKPRVFSSSRADLRSIECYKCHNVKVDSSVRLEVADDALLSIDGQCELEFSSSGQTFKVVAFVAPIREDGLIGLVFLYDNDYQLSAQSGLKLNGRKCRTLVEKVPLRAVRVSCAARTFIPANSECITRGKAINLGTIKSEFGLICQSDNKVKEHISVGNVLVSPGTINWNKVPVRLVNTSDKKIKLQKGLTLGYLHEMNSGDLLKENVDLNNTNLQKDKNNSEIDRDISKWSKDLKELYSRSSINLNDEQKKRLKLLLQKYKNVFSETPNDLGRTDIVKHYIDTSDARPIKVPPSLDIITFRTLLYIFL